MRYVSLFSGIEAASVAWGGEPLCWEPVAFSEIEPLPCAVLSERFPGVPNLGDIINIDWSKYRGTVDLVVGGSPCQAFSVAGKRAGLMDSRGQLMLEYVRAVREINPRWMLWENVPGVLSQSNGDAFDTLQGELAECGYSLAWRTLDAQFFGVAQRRRRVFLVGHSNPGCAAAVLFERESLRWDSPSSREKREALTETARRGASGSCLTFDTTQITSPENGNNPQFGDPCHPLCANAHVPTIAFSAGQSAKAGSVGAQTEVAPTLRGGSSGTNQVPTVCIDGDIARGAYMSKNGKGWNLDGVASTLTTLDVPAVCISDDTSKAACDVELTGTLKCGGMPPTVAQKMTVRRLMPVECERLQGFPDGWTDLGGTPDTPRYKSLGNSMAVPVMRWIGERIEMVDKMIEEQA